MCGITENGTIGLVDSRPKEVMWHSLAASDCPRLSKTRPRRNLQHEHCAIKFNDVMSCCIIFFHYFIYNKTDEMMFLRTLISPHLVHFNMFSVWSIVCYCHMTCSWLLTKTGVMWDLHLLLHVKLSLPSCCSLAHAIQCPTNKIDFLYQLILQIKRCLTHN